MNQYAGVDANNILPSAKHVVQFNYTTNDGKGSETLHDMVYVYTTPQSNPFDSLSEYGKLFDQLYGDLKINESFALLK
ncbi:hypothetical protein [Brevibacillus brevis]|uniref:hypothetical protein n=1 Tax=Brevibacillus brevis TaxID=1393 RepID=UPI0021BD0D64|nr:hypothetical protein [Brevibacillus brevis]